MLVKHSIWAQAYRSLHNRFRSLSHRLSLYKSLQISRYTEWLTSIKRRHLYSKSSSAQLTAEERLEASSLLTRNGFNITVPNFSTSFPAIQSLHWAVSNGHKFVVPLLLEKGVVASRPADVYPRPMLHIAAEKGDDDIILMLLEHGVYVNAVDAFGWSALSQAAERGRESSAKIMIDHGASVDAADWRGRTPLHKAALNGKEGVARILLDAGASLEMKDGSGSTALLMAVEGMFESVVRLLVERGACVSVQDWRQRTPLTVIEEKIQNLRVRFASTKNLKTCETIWKLLQGDAS